MLIHFFVGLISAIYLGVFVYLLTDSESWSLLDVYYK